MIMMEQLLQRGAIIGFSFPAAQEACTSSVHACGAPPRAAQSDDEALTINGVTPADVAACAARFESLERTFWRPSPPGVEAAHLMLRGITDKRNVEARQDRLAGSSSSLHPGPGGQAQALHAQRYCGELYGGESTDLSEDDCTAECTPAVTPMVPVLRFGAGRARGCTLQR